MEIISNPYLLLSLIEECGKMLAKGPPKKDKNGNIMKDKSGKMVHEPYVIKVLNTINFSKSLHYNPFAYIRSEKDILKLVTTIIVNTKGEGEKSSALFSPSPLVFAINVFTSFKISFSLRIYTKGL